MTQFYTFLPPLFVSRWIPGHWGECNVECGMGEQEQLMHCIETGTSGKSIYADEELCTRYAGAKPKYERACRGESDNCAEWTTGEWTEVFQCIIQCFAFFVGCIPLGMTIYLDTNLDRCFASVQIQNLSSWSLFTHNICRAIIDNIGGMFFCITMMYRYYYPYLEKTKKEYTLFCFLFKALVIQTI